MRDLPKTYDPKLVESAIYDMWMENDCFKAEPDPDNGRQLVDHNRHDRCGSSGNRQG